VVEPDNGFGINTEICSCLINPYPANVENMVSY